MVSGSSVLSFKFLSQICSYSLTCHPQRLQHESVGRAEGLTTEQLLAIRFAPAYSHTDELTKTLGLELVAAMSFTDWITKAIRVPDQVFDEMKKFLNNEQLVEITATAGCYNFVSRFVVALNVDAKADVPVPIPS